MIEINWNPLPYLGLIPINWYGLNFLLYLILFSVLRFFLFLVRGDVEPVGLGLKNVQWTALAILAVSLTILIFTAVRNLRGERAA